MSADQEKKASSKPKNTSSEAFLQEKYYKTLNMMNAMRNQPKDKKKTTIHVKNTTVTHVGGEDADTRGEKKAGRGDNFSLDANDVQINMTKVELNATDFLKAKFGVSSGQLKQQIDGYNHGQAVNDKDDVQRLSLKEESRTGVKSLTRDIFKNDKNQVLPIETASGNVILPTLNEMGKKKNKTPRAKRSGFRDYIEQEELDRATVNDFIGTSSRSTNRLHQLPSHIQLLATSLQQNSSMADVSKLQSKEISADYEQKELKDAKARIFSESTSKRNSSPFCVKSQLSGQNSMRNGSSLSSYRDKLSMVMMTKHRDSQIILQPSTHQGGVTLDDMHANLEQEKWIPHHFRVSVDNIKSHKMSPVVDSLNFNHSLPLKIKKKATQKDYEGLKSDKFSNMGQFVHNILHSHKNAGKEEELTPADYQTVKLPKHFIGHKQLSKSVNLRDGSEKQNQTINQDSILIQHQFDAGKSKLSQRIDLTLKAQLRMQQLMAMLKHKDAKMPADYKVPLLQLSIDCSEEEDDKKDNTEGDGKELKEDQHETASIAFQSQKSTTSKNTYQPLRSKSLHVAVQGMYGQNSGRMRDYQAISIKSKINRKGTLAVNGSKALFNNEDKSQMGDYESAREVKGREDISFNNVEQSLAGSFTENFAGEDRANGLVRSSSSKLHLPSTLQPIKQKSLNSRVDTVGSQNKRTIGVSNYVSTNLNRPKMQLINSGLLTSVPRRGKMVDTQKYIRQSLRPYVDSEYFGFTPKPRELKPLPASAKNRSLLVGDLSRNLKMNGNRSFFSPMNLTPKTTATEASTLNLPKRGKSSVTRLPSVPAATPKINVSSSYEPMILPKKRSKKNAESRHSRDTGNRILTSDQKAARMTMITEEPAHFDEEDLELLMDENLDLKGQLQDMVIIFEQYLKVATLKEKADNMDKRRTDNKSPMRSGVVPTINVSNVNSYEQSQDGRGIDQMVTTSQPMLQPDSRLQVYEDNARTPNNRSQLLEINGDSHKKMDSSPFKEKNQLHGRVLSARRLGKDEKMLVSLQLKENFFMNHHMPFMASPRHTLHALTGHLPDQDVTNTSALSSHLKRAHSPTDSLPLVSPRYQIKQPSSLSILAVNEHKTHNQLLKQIRKLWDKIMNESNYDEIGRVQAELKQGQKNLQSLQKENMRTNAQCLDTQQKTIKQQDKKKASKTTQMAEKMGLKVTEIENKLKQETERSYTLNTWGITHMIITTLVKVRLMEDLIECAQKQKVRPNVTIERELYLMRYLQSQTEQDIKVFLNKRDQDKWRTWDNPRKVSFVKPETEEHPDEAWIQTIIGYQYIVNVEIRIHEKICQEMVAFLNYCFGNEIWYTLWALKYHRESNFERHGKVMEQQRNSFDNKISNLNWLQLTKDNRDIAIVGPDPLWLNFVREANEKRKNKEISTAIDSNKMVDTQYDGAEKMTLGGVSSRAKPSRDDDGDVVVFGYEDVENKADDVLSRNSGEDAKQKARKDAEAARLSALQQEEDDEELLHLRKNWRDTIDSNKKNDEEERKRLEEARAKRLARLFRDDDEDGNASADDEPLNKQLDYGAATTGIESLIDKVEVHLQVEMNILRKWKEKDFQEVKEEAKKMIPLPQINKTKIISSIKQQNSISPNFKNNKHRNLSAHDPDVFRRSIDQFKKEKSTRQVKEISSKDPQASKVQKQKSVKNRSKKTTNQSAKDGPYNPALIYK